MKVSRDQWRVVAAIAASQHGLVARRQLLTVLTRAQLEGKTASGVLEPTGRGVYRIACAPLTWRQRVFASCLALGSPVAASHVSAGRLWDFEAFAGYRAKTWASRVHVTVPHERSGSAIPNTRIHRCGLDACDITTRHHVPATSALRTLGDLAGMVPADLLADCADEALRRGLVSPSDLEALSAGRYRHPGSPAIRALAVARVGGVGESGWEDRVFGWLVAAGLPPPVRQHPVLLPDGPVRLDLAYPDENVGIEFDGWAWHRGRQRFDRDRIRTTELALAGWTIVQVTSAQSEREVVGRVRRALLQSQAS